MYNWPLSVLLFCSVRSIIRIEMAGYRLFVPSVGRASLKCDNVTGLQSLAYSEISGSHGSENEHYSKPSLIRLQLIRIEI
jgi:hypothetical protein